jgi:hypothetical protein
MVGSIVGSARPEAVSDHAKAVATTEKTKTEFDAVLGESLDDVADTQFSKDRDADGRQLYSRRAPDAPAPETTNVVDEEPPLPIPRGHAADAFGDRGNALDIDA